MTDPTARTDFVSRCEGCGQSVADGYCAPCENKALTAQAPIVLDPAEVLAAQTRKANERPAPAKHMIDFISRYGRPAA